MYTNLDMLELLKLLAGANEKYVEYKSLIKNIEFDSKYFLDSIILSESLKSTQIEETKFTILNLKQFMLIDMEMVG